MDARVCNAAHLGLVSLGVRHLVHRLLQQVRHEQLRQGHVGKTTMCTRQQQPTCGVRHRLVEARLASCGPVWGTCLVDVAVAAEELDEALVLCAVGEHPDACARQSRGG